jgi:hypothetical protein
MFTSEQYRAKANEYCELAKRATRPNELREFRDLERSFTELADNAQWAADNYDRTLHAAVHDADKATSAAE